MKNNLNNMKLKNVWDEEDVHSLEDLLRDKTISEAMLGRAFAIMEIKGNELRGPDQNRHRCR